MCKVLELNGKTEILSFYSVILMFKPHFPAFPFCFGYYLTKFVPRLFLESDIALIFSSGEQFLDKSIGSLFMDASLWRSSMSSHHLRCLLHCANIIIKLFSPD